MSSGTRAVRLIALGSSIAAVIAAGAPAIASAEYSLDYCSAYWVQPKTRCPVDTPRHTYNVNQAEGLTYYASGALNWYSAKCERMSYWSDDATVYSRNCNTARYTTGRWDDFCGNCSQRENTGTLLKVYIGNNESSKQQKLWGKAWY